MSMERRNFFLSLAVAICIQVFGRIAFRDSVAGSQLSVVASFAIGQTLLFVLDGRERDRTHRKR